MDCLDPLVCKGIFGDDTRSLEQIIEQDAAQLEALGTDCVEIAQKLAELSRRALAGEGALDLGGWSVAAFEAMGKIPCPFDHAGLFPKAVFTATRKESGVVLRWSWLSLHLIEVHGFFEGVGSDFRLEPKEVVKLLKEVG